MIREIMHDTWFLSQKSEKATKEDAQIAQDLLDTLKANEEGCVGMDRGAQAYYRGKYGFYEHHYVQSRVCEKDRKIPDRRGLPVPDRRAKMH